MCFTSWIVPVSVLGLMAKAFRMLSGNAAPAPTPAMLLRNVRRSIIVISAILPNLGCKFTDPKVVRRKPRVLA